MANEQNLREPWKPGQSGNPKGRPKNRVPEQLVTIFGSKAKAKKFYCLSTYAISRRLEGIGEVERRTFIPERAGDSSIKRHEERKDYDA